MKINESFPYPKFPWFKSFLVFLFVIIILGHLFCAWYYLFSPSLYENEFNYYLSRLLNYYDPFILK